MKKPRIGETYYYVPYDIRHEEKELVVTKVGRKYFYTDLGHTFKINSFVEECGCYSPRGRLYDSKQSYDFSICVEKHRDELRKMIGLLRGEDILEVHMLVESKINRY